MGVFLMTSHADRHDLDKLARWREDLLSSQPGPFPVYAVFLVSPDDGRAHDVFRQFRTSFEGRGAGFEHLVIFGQHGVSSTTLDLLPRFGLSLPDLPTLVLLCGSSADAVYRLPLPRGRDSDANSTATDRGWRDALSHLEEAADAGGRDPDLSSIAGVTGHRLSVGTLLDLVGTVQVSVGDND